MRLPHGSGGHNPFRSWRLFLECVAPMILNVDIPAVSSQCVQCFGNFCLHPDGTLSHGDRQIHLAPKELAALRVLLRHCGSIVTGAQLQEELWGDVHVTADSVPRCISALRARLGSDGCVQTVYKQGYRLMLPVTCDSGSGDALPRLAIMPFSLGPGVPEHMGRALAEDATAEMTTCGPAVFQMLARDSVFMLASHGMSAQQAGEALNADFVLTGTVQAFASDFRLRLEMVRVDDGTQIWVEDLLVHRDQIACFAELIVSRLAFRAGRALPAAGPEPRPLADAQAYELLLRGRLEWQSLDPHRMQEGLRDLQRAGEMDPKLVQVPLEIVRATVARELFGFLEPAAAAEQVRHVAMTLQGNPPALAAISPAQAWFAFHVERDLAAALRHLEKCDSVPGDSWAVRVRALLAASRHRFDEASGLLQNALQTDPYSPWLGASLAWIYHLADDGPESVRHIQRCLEMAPDHPAPRFYGGMILAFRHDPQRAVAITSELVARGPQLDMAVAVHAYALARNGERQKAEESLERLQWLTRERYVVRSFSAAAYLALDDANAAVAELEVANRSRCPWFFQMLGDPRLRTLENRPEYRQLLAIMDEAEAAKAGESAAEKPGLSTADRK